MKKLQGSEKQVAWAEDLRKDFLERAEEYKDLLNKKNSEKTQEESFHEEALTSLLGLKERKSFQQEKKKTIN